MPEDNAEFDRLLERVVVDLGIHLDCGQHALLYAHYVLLEKWNDRMNLTSVRRFEDMVMRHFGESLAVAKILGPGDGSVVDIGSGGGFPGLPVAVYCPDRKITLVESVGKKAVFLKEAARNLGNVSVFDGRFEDLKVSYEWACMRAVASDGLSAPLAKAVRNVAVLVSASGADEVCTILGLTGAKGHSLPWDARTVVVTGRPGTQVPRGTETL
jgi:16S rRNA (guanine527-N7)-methyltransferase